MRAGSRGGVRTQVSGLVVETQQLSQYQEAIPAMGSSLVMVMLLDFDNVRHVTHTYKAMCDVVMLEMESTILYRKVASS